MDGAGGVLVTTCRSCGASLEKVLDLGVQPLANNFLTAEQLRDPNFVEPKAELILCVCPKCWLLQLSQTVDPKLLFSDYLYFTSCSPPMVEHAKATAEKYINEFGLTPHHEKGFEDWVCEIASNDGYLLQWFKREGIPCFGIEPARNVGAVARLNGIETYEEFFTNAYAAGTGKYDRRGADFERASPFDNRKVPLIIANNVFAHCPNIHDFVAGLRTVLDSNGQYGRAVLEFPYACQMIDRNEFDTIYHEHVFYFTLTALKPLFEQHGLAMFHTEHLTVHGGAIRIYVSKIGTYPVDVSIEDAMTLERVRCVTMVEYYQTFKNRVERLLEDLKQRVLNEVQIGDKRLAAYGASAKSTVLLNACKLNSLDVDFICDSTPAKQGRFTPGSHIPIVAPSELLKRQPDYCLLNIWNFLDSVLANEQEYRRRGGKFVVPIPEVKIV